MLLFFIHCILCRICHENECLLGKVDCATSNLCTKLPGESVARFLEIASVRSACMLKFGADATLVTPGDLNTNSIVYSMCALFGDGVYLDLERDRNNCSQWVDHSSGEVVNRTFWRNGEPDNFDFKNNRQYTPCAVQIFEGCGVFLRGANMTRWFDDYCAPARIPIVCGVCATLNITVHTASSVSRSTSTNNNNNLTFVSSTSTSTTTTSTKERTNVTWIISKTLPTLLTMSLLIGVICGGIALLIAIVLVIIICTNRYRIRLRSSSLAKQNNLSQGGSNEYEHGDMLLQTANTI